MPGGWSFVLFSSLPPAQGGTREAAAAEHVCVSGRQDGPEEGRRESVPNLDGMGRLLSRDRLLLIKRRATNSVGRPRPLSDPAGKQGRSIDPRVPRALQSHFPRPLESQPGPEGVFGPLCWRSPGEEPPYSHLASFVVGKFSLNRGKNPDRAACVHFL